MCMCAADQAHVGIIREWSALLLTPRAERVYESFMSFLLSTGRDIDCCCRCGDAPLPLLLLRILRSVLFFSVQAVSVNCNLRIKVLRGLY